MIVDSSAVVAVLLAEAHREELIAKLNAAAVVAIGAPILFETGMVMVGSVGEPGRSLVTEFLERFDVVVVPFAELHWRSAIDAFMRFGKGRHPAALNILDCMSYATARVAREPLLFVGNDFARTDVVPA